MYRYINFKLPFNKSFELCVQRLNGARYFDLYFRFNFAGHDHAGLKFFVQWLGFLFEFNITDRRHWNYELNKWES